MLVWIIIWIIGIIFALWITTNQNNKKIQSEKEIGIIESQEVIHLSGCPYIDANKKIILAICKNNTLHFYKNSNDIISRYNPIYKIPINQITRYELKTESEIQKDVTLTRLLALGIFAFGVKKKTEINNTYLILSYVQNNVPIDCIFKNAVNNQQLGNIISTLNRLKIEQNNIEDNYQTV